jgi:choline dehydrogenase
VTAFDVVVAGGGSAGCVVAARLSEDPGCSVCLVEAGPDYGRYAEGHWPADLLNATELAFSHSWERHDPADRSQLRARVLGGCSAHNACAMLPGAPADYDAWGHDWDAASLEPFLRSADRAMGTRRFSPDELAPVSRAVLAAAEELGLDVLADASQAGPGAGPFPVNAAGSVRWNAAFAYLDPARERSNLTILSEALADRVVVEQDRAVGLVAKRAGREEELRAGRVVLTCGAYGSPAVLLRSGIGPERGLPVGENLSDHPGIGVGWLATERLQAETARHAGEQPLFMAQVVVKGRSSRCADDIWDLHVFPATEPAKDELGHPTGSFELSAAVFAMAPCSRGSVRLGGPDPETPPVVEHGFLSDPADAAVLVDGLELVRRLGETRALRDYAAKETRPGSETDLERYVHESVRGYFHPAGTCALGSVVGEDGAVLGLDGLYVADASVIPAVPRANTNLTTLAVAERIAAGLR